MLLIENGYLITMDSMRTVIETGSVVIEGNRIIDVGKSDAIKKKKYQPDIRIDAKKKAILPSFINTHTHFFQVLLRSLGDDLNLNDWLAKVILPSKPHITPKDLYYASATACIESLRSGITTTCEMQYLRDRTSLTNEAFRACEDTGIRGVISYNPVETDRTKLHFTDAGELEDIETSIKHADDLHHRWHGKANGRLHAWCGPCATWTSSDEAIRLYSEWALNKGTKVPIHVCETQRRWDDFKRLTGDTPTEHLYRVSPSLRDKLIAIHAVALTDNDLDIFAREGAAISHNTTSNSYLGDGVARVPDMLRKGITVSLGLDGPASNCSQNMWEMLKFTALTHKVTHLDSSIISAEQVLEMAIIGGAKALGLENEIGSLQPGKKADIILVDLDGINYSPLNRVVSQLIYCGQASDVSTVIVDGTVVMNNHQITTIDEEIIKTKTQKSAEQLIHRAGMDKYPEDPWRTKTY